MLTLARITMGIQFQSIGALSPLLMERLGIGNAEIGVLIGLFSLPGVVLALPGGMLGQRLGERRLVVVGLLLMMSGSALTGEATRLRRSNGRTTPGGDRRRAAERARDDAGRRLVLRTRDRLGDGDLPQRLAVGNGVALLALPSIASVWSVSAAFHAAAGVAGLAAALMMFACPSPSTSEVCRDSASLVGLSRREAGLVTLAAVPWTLYNVGHAVMLGSVPALLVMTGQSVTVDGGWDV